MSRAVVETLIIDYNEVTIATELIEEIGPRGTFIDHAHTTQHFRRELWFPEILSRDFYEHWRSNGATCVEEECQKVKFVYILT